MSQRKDRKNVACKWFAYRNAECAVAFLTLHDKKTITFLDFVTDAVNEKAMPILKQAKLASAKEGDLP